ncbi:MAG: helix-turn-helix domain-containing protein [Proteobacteria bacterium]|nr:helix-turn-helix domain-containing protein [Cystobacterineae bacterium]MCL2258650.1 helix-turn-helix domain-containing protein [Cystobacterineae bacterium]MCL2314728.1 helix-turn-helix domain-containing protein [Pseudomonadota bacterium]
MTTPKMINRLREQRLANQLSQLELAKRAGISRQTLISVEAGDSIPKMDIALRLSAVLGVRVENLFCLEESVSVVQATLATNSKPAFGQESRVVLGEIEGRWVAHAIPVCDVFGQVADGFVQKIPSHSKKINVESIGNLEVARRQLLVMGCAPVLSLLAARLNRESAGVRLTWIQGSSENALEALRRGEVHVAGIHLFDEFSGRYNLSAVRKYFPRNKMLLLNFVSWEQGIVIAPGNPLKIRAVTDICRPKVRFVAREAGSGANELLERLLRGHRTRAAEGGSFEKVARGHMEVAHAVSVGAADAGIAIRGAALAYGLDFIPLAQERFDFVFPRELAKDLRMERLVNVLGSRAFRRELDLVGGYSTKYTGQQLEDTPVD